MCDLVGLGRSAAENEGTKQRLYLSCTQAYSSCLASFFFRQTLLAPCRIPPLMDREPSTNRGTHREYRLNEKRRCLTSIDACHRTVVRSKVSPVSQSLLCLPPQHQTCSNSFVNLFRHNNRSSPFFPDSTRPDEEEATAVRCTCSVFLLP